MQISPQLVHWQMHYDVSDDALLSIMGTLVHPGKMSNSQQTTLKVREGEREKVWKMDQREEIDKCQQKSEQIKNELDAEVPYRMQSSELRENKSKELRDTKSKEFRGSKRKEFSDTKSKELRNTEQTQQKLTLQTEYLNEDNLDEPETSIEILDYVKQDEQSMVFVDGSESF